MLRCSKCKLVKPLVAFVMDRRKVSGHKSYCRSCDNARRSERRQPRKRQPATSPYAIASRALITERLGEFPSGCQVPASSAGPARACPMLARCRRLPAGAGVYCEVSDLEAGVDPLKVQPDLWLENMCADLRPVDPIWLATFQGLAMDETETEGAQDYGSHL